MCNFFEIYVYLYKNRRIGLIYLDAESGSRMLRKVEEMEEIPDTWGGPKELVHKWAPTGR